MAAKVFLNLPGNLKMPALGLGTFDARNPAELEPALDKALELGYRLIDTAFAYETEKIIGNVLKRWFDSGKLKRDDIFITTKLPIQGVHPDRVELFIKKSLENLQLDYVDLYLIHFPLGCKSNAEGIPSTKQLEYEGRTDHAALWKKMEEQVDAGRAKTIGLSNYNIAQIETVLKTARIKPANLQVELTVFLQQKALVDFCHKNGITITAFSPLGSPGFNAFLKSLGLPEKKLPNILNDPVIGKIAKKYSKSSAQIALRFLIQLGVGAIPKSVIPKELEENINIFDFTIDDKDFKELLTLDQGESARLANWDLFPGIQEHPDYPFQK